RIAVKQADIRSACQVPVSFLRAGVGFRTRIAISFVGFDRTGGPMSRLHHFLASVALLLATSAVRAAIVVPADLQPGDQFRLMFVTTFAHDATSDDIAVYDAFVEINALAAGLTQYDSQPVAWHVLGSTFSVSAGSRLPGSQIPIYNVDDQLLFNVGNSIWTNAVNPTAPLALILTDRGATYGGL